MAATDSATPAGLIDLPAVAERLGVNHRHVRRLVAERRIPYVKWGHLLRFDPNDIDAWLDGHRHEGCRTAGVSWVSRRRPASAEPSQDQ